MGGRFEGIDPDAAGETTDGDAARDAATDAYLASFNQCASTELKYNADRAYLPNNYAVISRGWEWKRDGEPAHIQAPGVGTDVADARRRNPRLKVFPTDGCRDPATPIIATSLILATSGWMRRCTATSVRVLRLRTHDLFRSGGTHAGNADLSRFHDEAAP